MVDYSKHDARQTKRIPFGGAPIPRPWSWECIICHAKGRKYASGAAARRAAELHNGGPYNPQGG